MDGPFFYFEHVELWNQGKGEFFQILWIYVGRALIFMLWNVVYFSYFPLSMPLGLLCFLLDILDAKIGFLDPQNLGNHIKFVEFEFS